MLVDNSGEVQLGTPLVEGAWVVAEVIAQGRDPKIKVFKYKSKTRYRRRRGHRQAFTRVAIREILTDGRQAAEKPAQRLRRRSAANKTEAAAADPAAVSEAVSSLAATEATIEDSPARPPRAARVRTASDAGIVTEAERDSGTSAKPARRTRTKKSESGE